MSSSSTETNRNQQSKVHLLPFDIDYDGSAPINSYFQVKEGVDGQLVAHFRGRELVGKKVQLPTGVSGVNCVQDKRKATSDVHWEVTGTFQEFNHWQHDVAPEPTHMQEILDWFECANEIHSV